MAIDTLQKLFGHDTMQRQWPKATVKCVRQKAFDKTKTRGVKHLGNWPQTFVLTLSIAGGVCSLHVLIPSTFNVFKRFVVTAFLPSRFLAKASEGQLVPSPMKFVHEKVHEHFPLILVRHLRTHPRGAPMTTSLGCWFVL